MALLVPNCGEVTFLKRTLNVATAGNLSLRIYSNDITPAETDTAATYSSLSGFGYTAFTFLSGSWTFVESAPSHASYTTVTFTVDGNIGNAYGYFITEANSGLLVLAERFTSAPYSLTTSGSSVSVTPQITMD